MTTVRLSLSLPDEAHPNLEVSVEQPGSPDVVFDVPLTLPVGRIDTREVQPVKAIDKARTAEQETYELGGYAGI